MAHIKTLRDNKDKEIIYPQTITAAILDYEGKTLENVLTTKADTVNVYNKNEIDEKFKTFTITNPETGEQEQLPSGSLEVSPQTYINSEYFYRFKNLIDNSSFEVFDGNTMIPLGWEGGIVTADASMFGTHSLKINTDETARQTPKYQTNINWAEGAYDTDDMVLTFYHKFDPVEVKIYDIENDEYLPLTVLGATLTELGTEIAPVFAYEENWNKYRCMVKFTPASNTGKIRVELTCRTWDPGVAYGACFIDAMSLEPYVEGEFPSIYKDGRYSVAAYQLTNPPPADVDRFTPLEHLDIGNSVSDEKGNLTYQEFLRADGTLAIKREASNPDANGNYQTIVETFYRKDGLTINYVDTYVYSYSATGAILSRSKTTTEVL